MIFFFLSTMKIRNVIPLYGSNFIENSAIEKATDIKIYYN